MVALEELAEVALRRDGLSLRSLAQDFLRNHPNLSAVPRPLVENQRILGTAAALLELLAERAGQTAPDWTRAIGAVPEPIFLLKEAEQMKHLRARCETESPEPLKKRGLYAPAEFLSFA
jgi:hypothetical protein